MTPSEKLRAQSDAFLENTDRICDECLKGLHSLDRIIVSVSSSLSDDTRGYLTPIVYAYWERFFSSVFGEYLRCIEVAEIDIDDINPILLKHKLIRELSALAEEKHIPKLYVLAESYGLSDIRKIIDSISVNLSGPLTFLSPDTFVETEANVSHRVLSRICRHFIVDFAAISDDMSKKKFALFPELKNLLDNRNSIAHGEEFKSISSESWNRQKEFVTSLMYAVQFVLYEHLLSNQTLLK